jgi:hypothetical protein
VNTILSSRQALQRRGCTESFTVIAILASIVSTWGNGIPVRFAMQWMHSAAPVMIVVTSSASEAAVAARGDVSSLDVRRAASDRCIATSLAGEAD